MDVALTADTIADRVLGQQARREAQIYAVFFASGNNMVFQGDLARRVVLIDLEPAMERPEERDDFRHHPLLPWVHKERLRLVMAALTVLRAYIIAGSPHQGIRPLGSFEAWSTLVRQALIWAGEADPCAGRQDIDAESDPQYEALNSLLLAWFECYEDKAVTIKRVLHDIHLHTQNEGIAKWNDLRAALEGIDPTAVSKALNAQVVGYAIRASKGRMIAGKRFVTKGKDRLGATQWQIETLTPIL